jgi:hypothetical protein
MEKNNPTPHRSPMPADFPSLSKVIEIGSSLRIIYQPYTSRIVNDAISDEVVPEGKKPRYQVRTLDYNIEIMTKGKYGKWTSSFLPPHIMERILKEVQQAQGIEYTVDTWED